MCQLLLQRGANPAILDSVSYADSCFTCRISKVSWYVLLPMQQDDCTPSEVACRDAVDDGSGRENNDKDRILALLSGNPVPPPSRPLIAIGDGVEWSGDDVDIPRGDVGTVVGFKIDGKGRRRVMITFPNGPFALLPVTLTVVSKAKTEEVELQGEERFPGEGSAV